MPNGSERCAIALPPDPRPHVFALGALDKGPPIGTRPSASAAGFARNSVVARHGAGHDGDRTAQVLRRVKQR